MKLLSIILILLFAQATPAFDFRDWKLWGKSLETPDFSNIKSIKLRKQAFFEYLLPFIQIERNKILAVRTAIKHNRLSPLKLQKLAAIYRLKTSSKQSLLNAIDIIPTSLILAQAANESDWGRSRFAKYHYNFFGLWCFKKGCGIIPKDRHPNSSHEVAKFASPRQAIAYYLLTLNRHSSYQILRDIRTHKRQNGLKITGIALSEGLGNYSGIGYQYIESIKQIIKYNKLEKYD